MDSRLPVPGPDLSAPAVIVEDVVKSFGTSADRTFSIACP